MTNDFTTSLRPAFVLTILFALLLGIAYPLAMTGIGQALFPSAANGSLIERHGEVIGSTVIGQAFTGDRYFHTRPSAAGKNGYDGTASSGSNLGPASQALADRVKSDVTALKVSPGSQLPPDLVTASASGLDPDLSREAALYQVSRVATVRGLDPAQVKALIEAHVQHPLLGFLGEEHVNVLALNMALDSAKPGH